MKVKIYKRLKENINGENRYNQTPIFIFASPVTLNTFNRGQVTEGVINITSTLTLSTLQPALHDIIELEKIKPGDKVEFNGKKYSIKNIDKRVNGYDYKGSRKYIITLWI